MFGTKAALALAEARTALGLTDMLWASLIRPQPLVRAMIMLASVFVAQVR